MNLSVPALLGHVDLLHNFLDQILLLFFKHFLQLLSSLFLLIQKPLYLCLLPLGKVAYGNLQRLNINC
jgi:hypothetical protein